MSMVVEELTGITKLDKQINIIHPATLELIGSPSLHSILLNYLKMQDGHPMIAKVHQEYYCSPAHVIILQAKEAKRMTGLMHKNLPAYSNMLQEAGFTEDFIKQLIRKFCEASLVAEVALCKWDSSTRTLSTPVPDEKHKKAIKAFEGTAWFKVEFGLLSKGKKVPISLPQEDFFNLDGTALIKTIHN
jgi:hypothetical protein